MKKHYFSVLRQQLSAFMLKTCISAFLFCCSYASVSAQAGDTSQPLLFVENLDHFPSNDHFVFSRIQVPWTRDSIYTANHDSVRIRIRNKGTLPLVVNKFNLSDTVNWKIDNISGVTYTSASSLPLTISAAAYKDVIIKFIAVDQAERVKVLHDSLTILSNDNKTPSKIVFLSGLWQKRAESFNEPTVEEVITAFGLTTKIGFGQTDPDKGDSSKLKGDEIRPSYFVRADTSIPVSVIQLAAYHGCCNTQPEKIIWYPEDTSKTKTLRTLFTHTLVDGQTLLPRKSKPNTPAEGSFTPAGAFGFKVGALNWTDAKLNPSGKIGVRVWKAIDANGNIIPNAFILGNDYLGTQATNYDYQDNMYFVRNVRPQNGTSFYSTLAAAPSDIDFGEKVLKAVNSFELKVSNLGQVYADSSKDPAIVIDSVVVTGENKSEFSAAMPMNTTLNPQDSTNLTVTFTPATQGLKIADLLVYYKSAKSPLRVPLYGTARSSDTMVVINNRINSGSATPITINGKTWSADDQYAFDNIEPFTNPSLHQIAGTDEDSLYLKEQSSNADRKPFRYEIPVDSGDYVVRLHFAEIYWGAPGSGVTGGAGSRIMNISLENQVRLVNFDVTQEAGGSATALIKNLPVTVTDGKLNIDFTASVNRPMVVAVEVISFRPSTVLSSADPVVYVLPEVNKLKVPKVYPNPLQKRFMIEFPSTYSGNSTLQVSDALGHVYNVGKVSLQRGRLNKTEVDISNLPLKPGFYYLKIFSESRPADIIKLIIK